MTATQLPSYSLLSHILFFFFFHDPATTDIYTLSLHDALPISSGPGNVYSLNVSVLGSKRPIFPAWCSAKDRKSTRLNSSHPSISYAVFCLKKKKKQEKNNT